MRASCRLTSSKRKRSRSWGCNNLDDAAPSGWTSASYLTDMATFRSADIGPDFGAVRGAGDLSSLVGALLTYGLIVAVLMLVVSVTTWAVSSSSGSWHTAQKAKLGCFVAIGGATLTGTALTWANWLLDIGPHL